MGSIALAEGTARGTIDFLGLLSQSSTYRNLLIGGRYPEPRDPMALRDRLTMDPAGTLLEFPIMRSLMSGVAGSLLGFFLGIFINSGPVMGMHNPQLESMSTWEQVKVHYKDMYRSSLRTAKNFGLIGAIFSFVESNIQRSRASEDRFNGIYAGCCTGALIAWRAGPGAMAMGCGGFAVFSALMETVTKGR